MPTPSPTLAFISLPGGWEWIIILVIGLLLFGRRLPEIGRSIGKTIVEFKKGMNDIEAESNAVAPGTTANRARVASGAATSGDLPPSGSNYQPAERRVSTTDNPES
ncbi:MAG: twin-arginine translocase TatA/TatE family subunit [Phycisphaerales bacterium]